MLRMKMLAAAVCGVLLFAPVTMSADPLPAGAAAPNFTLPAQDGKAISLTDFKGKWVVLYFYPKDQTSGCSKEAHNFQRDQDKYKAANAVVLGVSLDTVESHATWCTKDGFSFKMLADPQHKVVDLYGVPMMTHDNVNYAQRDTFLISPQGKIVNEWHVTDIDGHSDVVLAAIKNGGK